MRDKLLGAVELGLTLALAAVALPVAKACDLLAGPDELEDLDWPSTTP